MEENEHRPSQTSLLPGDEDTSSDVKGLAKFLSLFELILPLLWTFAAAFSSYGSTLVHFVLLVFYSVGVNSTRTLQLSFSRWPLLLVLLSGIYSAIYLAGEATVYYISISKTLKINKILGYFDIYSKPESDKTHTAYVVAESMIIVIDLIIIACKKAIPIRWFSRVRSTLIGQFIFLLRFLFLISFAVVAASVDDKYSLFITAAFVVISVAMSLIKAPISKIVCNIFWSLVILCNATYLVFVCSDVVMKTKILWVPAQVIILCCFINTAIVCALIGVNRKTNGTKSRLINKACPNKIISVLAPFAVIILSAVFCLLEITWQSLACFILACAIALINLKVLYGATNYVFSVICAVICSKTFYYVIKGKECSGFNNFIIYATLGVASFFSSCICSERTTTEIHDEEEEVVENNHKFINELKKYCVSIITILLIVSTVVFSSLNHEVAYSAPLLIVIVLCLFALYRHYMWMILSVITFAAMILHFVAVLVPNKIRVDWLINRASSKPSSMVKEVWELVLVFVFAVCLRYFKSPPPVVITRFLSSTASFVFMCLAIVFINNSVFTCIYQIVIILFLFIPCGREFFKGMMNWISCVHLIILQTLNYPEVYSLIKNNTLKRLAGILTTSDTTEIDVLWPSVILICYMISVSYSNAYKRDDEPREMPEWATLIANNFWAVVAKFSFYIFWASLFLVVVASKGVSIIGSLMTIILSFVRILGFQGRKLGLTLFALFILDVLLMTISSIIDVPSKYKKVIDLIGPLVDTHFQKFINVCVSLTAFLQVIDIHAETIHQYVASVGSALSSLLLFCVQLFLTVLALYEGNCMGIIGSLLIFIVLANRKISKVGARVFTIILSFVLTYALVFKTCKFNFIKSTKWTDYLMLTNMRVQEIAFIFISLFVFSIYYEFGSADVWFGPTFLTAYAPTIITLIIALISVTGKDFLILIHSFMVLFLVLKSSWDKEFNRKTLTVCIFYTFIVILAKAVRDLKIFSQNYSKGDDFIGLSNISNFKWVFIFTLEFLLRCLLEGEKFNKINSDEKKRGEFRAKRAEIIDELLEIDAEFGNCYFNKKLDSLKEGFKSLTTPSPYPSTESFSIAQKPPQSQKQGEEEEKAFIESTITKTFNEEEEEEKHSKTNEEEDEEDDSYMFTALKLVGKFLKMLALWIVDKITVLIEGTTDINLEPGNNIVFMSRLKAFCLQLLNSFKEKGFLEVGEDSKDFVKTISPSFLMRFQILHRLRLHEITDETRWKRLYSSLKVISRQVVPLLLILICLFYPMEHHTIFSICYFFVAFFCVSFCVETYVPYVVLSCVMVAFRAVTRAPIINELISDFINSIPEKQRIVKIADVFGLTATTMQIVYESIVFVLAFGAQKYSSTHGFQTRRIFQHRPMTVDYQTKYTLMSKLNKLRTRFTHSSTFKLPITTYALVADLVSFLILLFAYIGWTTSGTFNSMISGTSTISGDFLWLLITHFILMIGTQVSSISHAPIAMFIMNFLFSLFTLFIGIFFIQYKSENRCFDFFTYNLYLFLRIFSELLFAHKLLVGFDHLPPTFGRGKPIFTYVTNLTINSIPFLFEFIYIIKWISSRTSIDLFDSLVISKLKLILSKRRAGQKIFSKDSDEKSHWMGYLGLILMIALLFIPFLLMVRSSSTSTPNPVKVASLETGVFGFPPFYSGTSIPDDNDFLTSRQQEDILNTPKNDFLSPFYTNAGGQSQFIKYPQVTSTNWIISDSLVKSSLESILNNSSAPFIPYVKASFQFGSTTTKNNVETVTITNYGDRLENDQIEVLKETFIAVTNRSLTKNITLYVSKLVPLYYLIPLSSDASDVPGYDFDVAFKLEINDAGQPSWSITSNITQSGFPNFVSSGILSSLVYSQPSFDALIGSLLSSTGGFLGLYAFIILTIGKFVGMYVDSFFDDLWIDKMENTDKLLKAIFAIEAYRDAGDLENEYKNAMILIKAVRSKHNIIQITNFEA